MPQLKKLFLLTTNYSSTDSQSVCIAVANVAVDHPRISWIASIHWRIWTNWLDRIVSSGDCGKNAEKRQEYQELHDWLNVDCQLTFNENFASFLSKSRISWMKVLRLKSKHLVSFALYFKKLYESEVQIKKAENV